jgi:ABC-type uncharacterized transport system permease subunit
MFTLMCDIFIMCFVLFLFLTYFGLNFNVMAAAASAAEKGGIGLWRRRADKGGGGEGRRRTVAE